MVCDTLCHVQNDVVANDPARIALLRYVFCAGYLTVTRGSPSQTKEEVRKRTVHLALRRGRRGEVDGHMGVGRFCRLVESVAVVIDP